MIAKVATGTEIYFEPSGAGEPLLLIAGTGCDNQYWALQVPLYAQSFDVIAVDARGGGRSPLNCDPRFCTSALMADDLASLLDVLNLNAAHVAGHSLGSLVCQQLLVRHPERVLSAQLHSTAASLDTWLRRAFWGTTLYALEHGDLQQTFKTVTVWTLSQVYLETQEPARVREMVTREFVKNPNNQVPEGMMGHLYAGLSHPHLNELRDTSIPVLITAGERDYTLPPVYGAQLSRTIPDCQYYEFSGPRSSHLYNWEMEHEFNAVTMGFLLGGERIGRS